MKGPNNLNSDEEEESAEEESQPKATKKRKKLNSSDEEWAPKKKKKQEKKKSRKLSSSEDDMREMDEANMSDAVDEDYSDSEVTVKRSATVEKAIHKFLQTASNSELQTVDTISGTFDDQFLNLFSIKIYFTIGKINFEHLIITKKGLKAKVIESHRPIKSLMDFKKKWESTKGCSNAEGLLSNIDELLKGRYQKTDFYSETR